MRRVIASLAAVTFIGAGTRLATSRPATAAAVVGIVSIAAVAAGLLANGRSHRRPWQAAWGLLLVGLVARVAGVLAAAGERTGTPTALSREAALHLAGALAGAVGAYRLVRHRHPGRAADVLFESAIGVSLLTVAVWLLGVEPDRIAGSDAAADAARLLGLLTVGLGLATVWALARLLWLTDDHPTAYRYLTAAFVCLVTVDAVAMGSLLGEWVFDARYESSLGLWGCLLFAASALHPSIRHSFDPVPSRSRGLGAGRVAFAMAAVLWGPGVVLVQAGRGVAVSFEAAALASALVPLLVTAELVRQVRERLTGEYLAQHDALTGLPNRVLFHDRLEVALAHARRSGRNAAVMFLDLDRFKEVNDSLGHDVGDQLLQAVARRIRRCLRDHDTVARLGGDEFSILLGDLDDPAHCAVVAQKLLDAFARPFPVKGRELLTATSIGAAVFPADGVDADTLLKNADTAMYRAKARGRGSFEFYAKDMSTRAEVRHSLESSLHRAVQRGDLTLHYQPKVRRGDGRVLGVEALVRWQHPRVGAIPPSAFIPLAEESGLILPLGEWVLAEACRQAAEWSQAGVTRVPVAVNVSARQFIHEPLDRVVGRVLDETGLDASLLELELTESVFLRDLNSVNATMSRLRDIGVRCSIDDFGTGFSGLSYLQRMPIDALKIDRSFVGEIHADAGAPIVTAVIAMAKNLGVGVVAEGVETEDQAAFLLAHGCEQMQGYLFCRPLPAAELEHTLRVEQGILRGTTRAGGLGLAGAAVSGALADLDPRAVAQLLGAACRDGDPLTVEDALVERVLAELQADELSLTAGQWSSRSLSARLAAGTFAGLLPLSGGLAAADVLPGAAQQLASRAFANVGMEMPTLVRPVAETAAPAPANGRPRPERVRVRPVVPATPEGELAIGHLPMRDIVQGPAAETAPPQPSPPARRPHPRRPAPTPAPVAPVVDAPTPPAPTVPVAAPGPGARTPPGRDTTPAPDREPDDGLPTTPPSTPGPPVQPPRPGRPTAPPVSPGPPDVPAPQPVPGDAGPSGDNGAPGRGQAPPAHPVPPIEPGPPVEPGAPVEPGPPPGGDNSAPGRGQAPPAHPGPPIEPGPPVDAGPPVNPGPPDTTPPDGEFAGGDETPGQAPSDPGAPAGNGRELPPPAEVGAPAGPGAGPGHAPPPPGGDRGGEASRDLPPPAPAGAGRGRS